MHPLDSLLETYRTQTANERDKGTGFEKLISAWLVTDPVYALRFDRVESWSDWGQMTFVVQGMVGKRLEYEDLIA